MDENQFVQKTALSASSGESDDCETGTIKRDNVVSLSPVVRRGEATAQPAGQIVSFSRRELDRILRVYGFKVAEGEWRDYAIDMLKDRAVFSVYRRTSEVPMHCIEKVPKLARKQGTFVVTGSDGRILKRGHDLDQVLKVFDKKPKLRLV